MLGGQALIWTPVLFVITIFVLGPILGHLPSLDCRRGCCLVRVNPVDLFRLFRLQIARRTQLACVAYFSASILLARYVAENGAGERWRWTIFGCILAMGRDDRHDVPGTVSGR